jgi:ribosomal protein S18 acetylase RimI-like enzyme
MTLHRITDPSSPAYPRAEQLLTASFPREEYRDLSQWRAFVATRPAFHLTLTEDGNGLLSYWDFGTFIYVEHLAVAPDLRGRGYGSLILSALKAAEPGKPIVLEVEMPEDELTRRRVRFYERNGFTLWRRREYLQPPYRKGDAPIPMRLMAYGEVKEEAFEEVKERIYMEVYGWKNCVF